MFWKHHGVWYDIKGFYQQSERLSTETNRMAPPVIRWFITPSIVSYTIVTIVIIKLANELGPNPERNMRFHWNMWWNGNSMRPVETISRWVWRK
jgi:hypothetical protein